MNGWQGAQPQILYCQHGSTSVRLVYTVMPAPVAGKKTTEKQGSHLKGDNKKPIVAMTCHPSGKPSNTLPWLLTAMLCHREHAASTLQHMHFLADICSQLYLVAVDLDNTHPAVLQHGCCKD